MKTLLGDSVPCMAGFLFDRHYSVMKQKQDMAYV